MQTQGKILIIAGSDSGGGAGIQADIKTVAALGGFAMTAVTALTAQNSLGVQAIMPVPTDFILAQLDSIFSDFGADAIKIGMVFDPLVIKALAEWLTRHARNIPIILDPVMVAKGGASLIADHAVAAMTSLLVPLATCVTPNIPEAETLSAMTISTLNQRRTAAKHILSLGAKSVLIKGGHADQESTIVTDLLVTPNGEEIFTSPRLKTSHSHGTGCSLASGIACGIAQGRTLSSAVNRARNFVAAALGSAPGLSDPSFAKGHGPLNHAVYSFDSDA
ncbi:MAG: bifunctional hydroxymethylpyrimidine kinase/phosphomethylpyrimidine kinase [Candidatus Pacebacteria bacterium]|nr:bifunctional hydroxymethylpyrimidine kinase/phosphomethylpyrimidine kinase [Candidatus Paceibacterota bacterium]